MNKGNDDGGDFQKEFENVVAMNSVTRNLRHLNSISMAYFDFYLHSRYDPAGNQSVSQVYDSLSALMDLWPAVKGNHNESSFYHFATMPCGYYTYLLSGEIARRWFDVFFRDRTMRWTLGPVFEQLVLRNGTTVPESTMMTQFENLK
jgi:Zn-dependent oligopeptidase